MKRTNIKCKQCKKNIGMLDTDGKPMFRTLKEGAVEYNGLFCSEECFREYEEKNKQKVSKEFYQWLNCWANFNNHKECFGKNVKSEKIITEFGRGYNQAVRDIFDRIRLRNSSPPVQTSDRKSDTKVEFNTDLKEVQK